MYHFSQQFYTELHFTQDYQFHIYTVAPLATNQNKAQFYTENAYFKTRLLVNLFINKQ